MRAILSDHLGKSETFGTRLRDVHAEIRAYFPFVHRVAIALYDPKTDALSTFVHSSGEAGSPLVAYRARLSDSPSLAALAASRTPRSIPDLSVFAGHSAEHSQRILAHGYRSSYTTPMYADDTLLGFLFFDSFEPERFSIDVNRTLELFSHLLTLVVVAELNAVNTLLGTVQLAHSFTRLRDVETGAHLDRMARYSRIVADGVAPELGLDDEFVEHVFLFAPLHDIGKIGIPDAILLKPARLTTQEERVMRTHVTLGDELVGRLLSEFHLSALPHVHLLRDIIRCHHEALDGSGYPAGLQGDAIPIGARIVAVADIFDALTSRRPYKEAWHNHRAFQALHELAGTRLDARCVAALVAREAEVVAVQERFGEWTRA